MRNVLGRSWVATAAILAAAGLAVSACGTIQMGAAAITGSHRISSATLTAQVANLSAAYHADRAKGVTPQRPVAQAAQQVLTWLITFQIYDKLAAQHGINVTPAQAQKQIAALGRQAKASKVSLAQYVSAAGALPPDLVPQLGRYFAILTALERQLDGGKAPTSTAGQTTLRNQVGRQQCLAAKDLGVRVNPQYGQFDYASYSVVTAPPTLAADPSPSVSATPAVLHPPC